MGEILTLRCSRCGKPYSPVPGDGWFGSHGGFLHLCEDGILGEGIQMPISSPDPVDINISTPVDISGTPPEEQPGEITKKILAYFAAKANKQA